MDSREINKIAAAVLCAVVAFGAADLAGAALVPVRVPPRPAFPIAGLSPDGAPATTDRPAIALRLASASPQRGEKLAGNLCAACHSFAQGGPVLVGPNLHGVAGGPVAAVADYDYSPALKQAGGRWSPERLDAWLIRPRAFAPGTRMGFAGIPDDGARADVVSYLLTLSDRHSDAGPATPVVATSAAATSTAITGAATTGAAADDAASARVAKADVKVGEAAATAACSACHSFDKGGEAQIGPALYGVFGRPIAQDASYSYSAALSAHHDRWTAGTLDDWLRNPRRFAPGTKMGFPGIADDARRAAVIAYLRSLSG